MKILLVATQDKGGAGIACVRLHLGLLAQGIKSKLLLLNRFNQNIPESYAFYENQPLLSIFKKIRKRLTFWNYDTMGLPKGYEPFLPPYSVHKLHEHPLYSWADVINLHWVAYFLDYPSFFQHNKKPIIWTLHDMNPFTGGHHYEVGFPIEAYQRLIKRYTNVKKTALANQNLTIVSPSVWLKEKSKASEILHSFQHLVIPYGLNKNLFMPRNQEVTRKLLNLPIEKKVLLFVAMSLSNQRKGYAILKQAIKQIRDKSQILLLILGDNQIDYPNIETHTLGFLREEEKIALAYAAADIFVLPSIEDNLPNTVLESLMCGTPVVGFRIGGVPDMIINGKNGFLCEEMTAKCLTHTIEQALYAKLTREWIRKDAVRRFDSSVQAKRYIQFGNVQPF